MDTKQQELNKTQQQPQHTTTHKQMTKRNIQRKTDDNDDQGMTKPHAQSKIQQLNFDQMMKKYGDNPKMKRVTTNDEDDDSQPIGSISNQTQSDKMLRNISDNQEMHQVMTTDDDKYGKIRSISNHIQSDRMMKKRSEVKC